MFWALVLRSKMLISRFLEALKAQNLRFWVSLGKNLKYSSQVFHVVSVAAVHLVQGDEQEH